MIAREILIGLALTIYFVSLFFIFVYSLTQANLAYLCLKRRRNANSAGIKHHSMATNEAEWPFVTVQLPIFNELYVVGRAIDSVASLTYPKDRFEIQLLDDSTDETSKLISNKLDELKMSGVNIHHIRRRDRTGFKAGALAHGLLSARGELIAIFDADFLPAPDFLLRTIPYFLDKNIGVVQTRWDHVNEDYSLLTRLQAFALDAHFNVEQHGRDAGGYFINFNGTAGVWRKSCILDAGNWHSDTLTEDLDLSYRAQLKGWKFKYLQEVGTPAELPVNMNALKTQQFRWTKGAAECARKNLRSVLQSKELPVLTKIHALFHLTNSSVFLCILILSLLSIPLFFVKKSYPQYSDIYLYASFSLLSLVSLAFFYWISAAIRRKTSFLSFLKKFFSFLSFSMGLSLHNSIAILEGYLGKKSSFVRTSKFNIVSSSDSWKGKRYLVSGVNLVSFLEGILALYFLGGVCSAFYLNDYGLLPFHIMLSLGFGAVCGYSFLHSGATTKRTDD